MSGHSSRTRRGIDVGRVFQALADPTRRAIVERLGSSPLSVSQLAAPLHVTLTAVAQHVQILVECGLVETRKTGRVRTCRMVPRGLDTLEVWIRDRRKEWEQRLDRLGELLADDDN